MKKTLLLSAVAVLLLSAVSAVVYVNNEADAMDDLFNANVEALARGEGAEITVCLGLWGSCTAPNGAVSKAPLATIKL